MLTKKSPNLRNRELAQIHIAKARLGLDEETYRDMLWTIGRVQSSKDLDHAGRRRVLEHLTSRGWNPKKQHVKPAVASEKQLLVDKIGALLTVHKLAWAYADGIARQMYKREKLQWCTAKELRGVIAALSKRKAESGNV